MVAILEDSLAVSHKIKHTPTSDPTITSLIFIKRIENLHQHKNLYMDVYNRFIQNTKTWTEPSFDRLIYSYTDIIQTVEYYSALHELSSCEKTQRKHKHILLNERSQSEQDTCYMIPTIWHFGKGKSMDTVKRPVAIRPGVREENRDEQAEHRRSLRIDCSA